MSGNVEPRITTAGNRSSINSFAFFPVNAITGRCPLPVHVAITVRLSKGHLQQSESQMLAEDQRERGGFGATKICQSLSVRGVMITAAFQLIANCNFIFDISWTHLSESQFCRLSEDIFGRSS
jgi:hypothetical protein